MPVSGMCVVGIKHVYKIKFVTQSSNTIGTLTEPTTFQHDSQYGVARDLRLGCLLTPVLSVLPRRLSFLAAAAAINVSATVHYMGLSVHQVINICQKFGLS